MNNTAEKRLIDVNALLQSIVFAEFDTLADRFFINEMLRSAPTVDAVEVVHGRWVYEPVEFTYEKDIKCSICGSYVEYVTNYCPNCGARMDA